MKTQQIDLDVNHAMQQIKADYEDNYKPADDKLKAQMRHEGFEVPKHMRRSGAKIGKPSR